MNLSRPFGKELSNLVDQRRQSFPSRMNNKSSRGKVLNDISRNIEKQIDKKLDKNNEKKIEKQVEKRNQNKTVELRSQKIEESQSESQPTYDPQLVPEYFDECLGFILQQEQLKYNLTDYISEESTITTKMRGILVDWLIDIHYKCKMFPETIFTTTMILDKYLSTNIVSKENLQLVGAAAFLIAAKYEETYQVPQVYDLVQFSAHAFTKSQIIQTEAEIIKSLNFELIMITPFRFFEALTRISKMERKNMHLAHYVLELSLLETRFMEYKPSHLASASIYLINKIRKKSQPWPDLLVAATGLCEQQLKTCAKQLCYLLQKAQDLPNTSSIRKKFSTQKYSQITRIRLQRKK